MGSAETFIFLGFSTLGNTQWCLKCFAWILFDPVCFFWPEKKSSHLKSKGRFPQICLSFCECHFPSSASCWGVVDDGAHLTSWNWQTGPRICIWWMGSQGVLFQPRERGWGWGQKQRKKINQTAKMDQNGSALIVFCAFTIKPSILLARLLGARNLCFLSCYWYWHTRIQFHPR